MKLLLDTHAALWWAGDDDRIGPRAAELFEDGGNQILLSAAVVWEIAIKSSAGKLEVPGGLPTISCGAGLTRFRSQ